MNDPLVVLAAKELCKRFGAQRVVQSVSLSCVRGEIILLLGANGAGKSTFLRLLAGLVRPDSGVVTITTGSRRSLSAHYSFLYGKLSVRENLDLYSKLLRVAHSERDEIVSRWRLGSFVHAPVSQLSKGTQAKVSLVRALLGNPDVLLLDEPSSNLDEASIEVLRTELLSRKESSVSIIATHDVTRLKDLATRVVVLERGVCVADSDQHGSREDWDGVIQRYYEANR